MIQLATPGQAVSYVHGHATASANGSSINSNHIQSKALNSAHKLGRTTFKLIESSQNSTTKASSSTTATAKNVLMKSIAVRGNRSSGFHSATQSAPANSIKSNSIVNDNVVNCVKKALASTATTINNGSTSKSTTKPTSANTKSGTAAIGATTSSASSSSSSSSSSARIVLSASFLKTYTVPPTDLHRCSAARLRSYSIDSLYDEMCHFKPIRSVPTTPWKCGSKSRGATIKAPKARLGQKTSNCDVNLNTKRTRKNSKRECSKAKAKIKPKLSANLFPHIKPHPSAFARLLLPMCSYTIPSSTHRICKRLQSLKTPETTSEESKETAKTSKKRLNTKRAKKQRNITIAQQRKIEQIDKVTANPKLSNTKKRKAPQMQSKKRESTASKKSKIDSVNRKTPPLTRRRIRMEDNCKLYGPLA